MIWNARVRLLALLVAIGMVCAGWAYAAPQSRASKRVNSRITSRNATVAERADVDRFRRRIDAALSTGGAEKGVWGVLVADEATGEALYARNADTYFMPASVAKLFTTALALATLGSDYREHSQLGATGPLNADGVLQGDLVLLGGGDPDLSNRKFPYVTADERDGSPDKALAELADAAVAHGVKTIAGDVIADDSLFQHEPFPSGWLVDDLLWSYGGAVSAICVNDNTFTVDLHPGAIAGDPARADSGNTADYYTIENLVTTSPRGTEEKLAAARDPGSRVLHLSGTMPLDAPPRRLNVAVDEPAESAAVILAKLLSARGVQITGVARARHAGDPGAGSPLQRVFADRISAPLSDEVRLTNKNSENLHAELLLLLSGHERAGARNYEDSLKVAAEFFKTAGIADGDVVLSDGSGLSRKDLVTPRAVVQILRYAATQPWGKLYRSSLPIAGEDGTLENRMKNTPAAGHVFAKTGTIGHGNGLAGYATTTRGAQLVFAIFGNNSNLHAQDANRVIDSMVLAMVEELGPGR